VPPFTFTTTVSSCSDLCYTGSRFWLQLNSYVHNGDFRVCTDTEKCYKMDSWKPWNLAFSALKSSKNDVEMSEPLDIVVESKIFFTGCMLFLAFKQQ